jgi:hypothetical protein
VAKPSSNRSHHCGGRQLALIAIATVKQFIELRRDLVVTWHKLARRIGEISRTPLKHNESGSSQRRRPTQPKLSQSRDTKLACSVLVKPPTDTCRRIRPERSGPNGQSAPWTTAIPVSWPKCHRVAISTGTRKLGSYNGGSCRFPNLVSYRDVLTSRDADCLTRCHLASVSDSCHFFRRALSIPWRHIQSLRVADQRVRRFRHVTALSEPQLTHSPASVGDERPSSTVHLAPPTGNLPYSIPSY